MRIGFFEIVLILAVLLSVLVVWRWFRQGQSGAEDSDSTSSFLGQIGLIGVLLALGGVGLLLLSYVILIGLAKMFIWALMILIIGIAFIVLSRR